LLVPNILFISDKIEHIPLNFSAVNHTVADNICTEIFSYNINIYRIDLKLLKMNKLTEVIPPD
jgi:hypothetical protein